jgi:hypothetical protein
VIWGGEQVAAVCAAFPAMTPYEVLEMRVDLLVILMRGYEEFHQRARAEAEREQPRTGGW